MVLATIRMPSRRALEDELLEAVKSTLAPMRSMRGCRGGWLSRDLEDGHVFYLSSCWEEEAHFKSYLRSREFSTVLVSLELLREAPTVKFHSVARTDGIELIAAERGVSMEDEND